MALLITSILGMGVGVLGLLFAGQIHANPNGFDADIHKALDDNPDLQPDQRITLKEVLTAENVASYTATCCGIGLVGNLAVMLGAIQMMRMRLYGFALLATVLALIPISPVCIVQAPFGIWGLIVLMDSNVRRSFA